MVPSNLLLPKNFALVASLINPECVGGDRSLMVEIAGYVLRIVSDYWVDHVFNMVIYHTNLRRKWMPDQTIIFIHKTECGDAAVGYGVMEKVCQQNELSEEERLEHGKWKEALVFRYVIKLEKPLLLTNTFLKEPRYRGRYLQGLPLNKEQLGSILSRAESSSK